MECSNILGYPGWQTSPKSLSAVGVCPWNLLFPPKRDLLFPRHSGTHSVLGNEGAEQWHLTNLAVLVKDIIAFSCLFLPPFCKRLLPPQHKPGEGSTLLSLPTQPRVQRLELLPAPTHQHLKLQNLHCSRRGADPDPRRGWGLLSCPCQPSWCGCLYLMDQLLVDSLQGQGRQVLAHLPPADLLHEAVIKNFLFL